MTLKLKKSYLISFVVILLLQMNQAVYAQNLGSYTPSFPLQQLRNLDLNVAEFSQDWLFEKFSEENYPGIGFGLAYKKESLGAFHFCYQVFYQDKVLEFYQLKLSFNKQNGELLVLQHNIPNVDAWNDFVLLDTQDENQQIGLIINKEIKPAEKRYIEAEDKDLYVNRYYVDANSYYENDLKSFNDTLVYCKVFNPDPLTSALQLYGGTYQDAFSKDTTGLYLQTIANSGASVLNTPAKNYTLYNQTFNVSVGSYDNVFAAPVLYQVFESIYLSPQLSILGYNAALTDDLASYTTKLIIEDYNYPQLENELVWKSMDATYTAGEFKLQNAYFILSEFSNPFTNETLSTSDSFVFNRSDLSFEDVNAFYHLDAFRKYWQSLGFTDLNDAIILVDAHGNNGADNSFFTSTNPPRLVFGQGGVDDAEDADVVVHEYGHGLSYFASPGSNIDSERRALDEGFGDYLASSYSASLSNFNKFNVFSWDGHNEFWAGRVSNSTKTKQDLSSTQNIYFNGEIWSATLMDLQAVLGRTITDQLAIEVMYYNLSNSTLSDAAFNLFTADTAMFNGVHTCQIFDVLLARKFLLGTCTDFYSGILNIQQNELDITILNSYGFANLGESIWVELKGEALGSKELNIYDVGGKLISSETTESSSLEIENQSVEAGLYFVELKLDGKVSRFKILKNN